MSEEIIEENKRISKIKQQVLNPKGPAPMMTGAKYVGMMNELILKKEFKSKDEWEEFYYKSGEERLRKIKDFVKQKYDELKESGSKREKVPKLWIDKFIKENNLWEGYGRTEKELEKLGEILYKNIPTKIMPSYKKYLSVANEITLQDCQNYIKEVVIDTTWVGEIKRGINVVKTLKKMGFGTFMKTSGNIDVSQAVDYELSLPNGKVGIQIKPESFEPIISKANKKAQEKFEGRVFTIKANKDGYINDKKVISELAEEIKRLS